MTGCSESPSQVPATVWLRRWQVEEEGLIVRVGDAVEWDEWVFTVTALDGRRVDRVRITSGDSTSVAGGAPGSSGAGDETD